MKALLIDAGNSRIKWTVFSAGRLAKPHATPWTDTGPFARWLADYLPEIPLDASTAWLEPAVVLDPSDGKLAHLDGLNLSRAWMLEGIASALPPNDSRVPSLLRAADRHRTAGLAAVTGEHYEGGHWLGSFAVYLTTKRGITER